MSLNKVTDSMHVKAVHIAAKLNELSRLTANVTAEEILIKCRDEHELNFYYYKIFKSK